jgi:hypothetical protein
MSKSTEQNDNAVSDPKTPFQKVFEPFVDFMEEVAKYNGNGTFNNANINPIASLIRKYRAAYKQTKDKPTHPQYFIDIFVEFQKEFDKAGSVDDFSFWLGKEKKSFKIGPKDSPVYLPLSITFRTAIAINKELTLQAEKDVEAGKSIGIVYPDYFMLYLLRIFQVCLPVTHPSQLKIAGNIAELEEFLRLERGENPSITDGITDMMSMAEEVFSEMGTNIPKGAFNPQMVKNALREFKKNGGEAKKQIKKIFKGVKLNGKDDIPNAFATVLEKIKETSEELPDAVKKANAATADNPDPSIE